MPAFAQVGSTRDCAFCCESAGNPVEASQNRERHRARELRRFSLIRTQAAVVPRDATTC